MNWSSVKNLLIAILVAANLFLIYNIARQDMTLGYIPEEEILGALELLSERGLYVPKDAVPAKKFKAPVYESLFGDEYYTATAEALTGAQREILYTLPDGGFSITAKNGASVELDTEFDFKYTASDISDVSAYTDITADSFSSAAKEGSPLSQARMSAAQTLAIGFLCARLPDDTRLTAQVVDGFVGDDGCVYLLMRQTLDDYSVYSHYAVCVLDTERVLFAHGRWYFSPIDANYNTETSDQVSILFTDLATLRAITAAKYASEDTSAAHSPEPTLQAENIQLPAVTSISACYAAYWNSDKTALYFIPAWQIDHNDLLTIVYNATNSTVYSTNQ